MSSRLSSRAASMRAIASRASPVYTPPRATATTSSIVSEPPSISSCTSVRGRTLVIRQHLSFGSIDPTTAKYARAGVDTTESQDLACSAQQMRPLDDVDRKILSLLRENSRRTLGDIGEQVSLSVAAVK